MNWNGLLLSFIEAWPIAIAVWLTAAWLWRKYGDPRPDSRDSELGKG
jgi:hypothetical protein